MSRMVGRADAEGATKLVVVPNVNLGHNAERYGLIEGDEAWCSATFLHAVRGLKFDSWRYLDTLDRPPSPGSKVDVVEAWLARPDESPFPPLNSATRVLLDSMVMFAAP